MSVDWDGYEPYVPPFYGLLNEMPRRQARQSFEHLMASRRDRFDNLKELLRVNGVEFGSDDASIQRLNDWFRENVEASATDPSRLRNLWYAVVNDVALYLGDVMIERSPGLWWEMFTRGAKNVSYQRPVLVGFTRVPNPNYNVDVDRLVAGYGHRIIAGHEVASDQFLKVLRSVAADV
jgi:hypothetical protein